LLVRHLELRGPSGALLRVAASDGQLARGPTPSLAIGDELWAHKSGDFYDACRSALVKRSDARLLVLSTAPSTIDRPLGAAPTASPLRSRRAARRRHRRRRARPAPPGMVARPERDDLDDDRLIAPCNPVPWIDRQVIAEQRAALPR